MADTGAAPKSVGKSAGQDGAWLRRLRTSAGLTQAQLAAQAAVGVRTVRDLERGGVRPRAASLRRLAAALGIDADQLDELAHGDFRTGRPPAADDPDHPDHPDESVSTRLRIDVLGPLSVRRGPRTVSIPSAMQRTLLGLLAIQPDQVAGVEEIIDTLWGSAPPRTSRELVHTYVSSLRRLLAAPGAPAPLRREPTGYRLRIGPEESDAAHFADLAARARRAGAAGAAQASWQLHGEALACWRGPLLAGESGWAVQHPAAVSLGALRVAVAVEWADFGLGLGHYRRTAQVLLALCAQEPLHEGLAARLMVALAGEGRQAAALDLYTGLRERLDTALGVKPGPELREAHLRVLRGRLPPATRPVGLAHSTGAAGGERLSRGQGETSKPAESGAGNAPPARAEDRPGEEPRQAAAAVAAVTPAQIPVDVAGFVGREAELRALDALLAANDDHASRIVVMTGMGGVGKTALAVRWARAARDRFPDGQLYADLRGHGVGTPVQPVEVIAGFLGAFGVAAAQVPGDEDQASALLRSVLDRRRVLILLDNAADVEQVRPLLPASAGCAAIVTSRRRLGGLVARDGAAVVDVRPLSAAESADLLARAIGPARAQAETEAVAQIADLCAHLPLALRITAANLATRPAHSVADHVTRLTADGRLDALAVEGDPHTAVRATFELSCAALHPGDLHVFRLAGLAPGPDVTAGQVAALADVPIAAARAVLGRLEDRNLLFEYTSGRFKFHDLVRLYAFELAEGAESARSLDDARDRLTAYYLAGTSRAARLLYPHILQLPGYGSGPDSDRDGVGPVFKDGRAALAWLDAERPGLVAATVQLADAGAVLPALELADRLTGYLHLRGDRAHWPTIARVSLQVASQHGGDTQLAMAWLHCGMATRAAADQESSAGHFTRSAEAAHRAGWVAGEAVALNNLATALWARGHKTEAVNRLGEALALHRLSGRTAGEAVTLANLGSAHIELARDADRELRRTQLDQALGLINQSWELHRRIGDRRNEAEAMRLLALVHRELGDDARALDLAHAALRMVAEAGDLLYESSAHSTLATLLARTGETSRAFEEHERALAIARSANAPRETAEALMDMAETHALLAQYDEAVLAAGDAQAVTARADLVALRRRADRLRERLTGTEPEP
ncbi:helix-turn-helix domain-containing protein [Actinospica sp. MGRD01-02]|uniref:Helix-turn-helix domain-containing protein n=1 Tax=Actinospica acidithermotolerans TaxID=2828514 RepID=A0A941IMC2_9ACTN|nr:BTAD domain-containing putative transcriptional regulator [Actinospica acidithermotolerans]MBR7828431.1 helix-turn-helix domain-containing protein [Actinospica acidithermotolerans]